MEEIEKKFLLKEIPDLRNAQFYDILQAYISYDPEIRIRKRNNNYFLTQKGDGTLSRPEIETSIDEISFQILLSLVKTNIIEKQRFMLPLCDGFIAELDIYHGQLEGLASVEVEFASIEQAERFVAPLWFGEDVTNDKRFKNKNLSKLNTESLGELILQSESNYLKILPINIL